MNATATTLSPTLPPAALLPAALPPWDRPALLDNDPALDPEWPVGQLLYPDYVPEYDDTLSPDDPEYYPCHPEIAVVENERHVTLLNFLLNVLRVLLPGRGVFSRLSVHWQRGNRDAFAAPDVMVTEARPPRELITSYVTFLDPPIQCVVEVVSGSNEQKDLDKKFADYQNELKVPEYLLLDPIRNTLVLYRMDGAQYKVAPADDEGRLWSEQCRVWFAWDPKNQLRIWDAAGREQRDYEALLVGEARAVARAEEERLRADRMAARLRELGFDLEP